MRCVREVCTGYRRHRIEKRLHPTAQHRLRTALSDRPRKGDLRDALDYHEKYMAADKGHLDDLREKALAYQLAKQQVDAKKYRSMS